MVEIFPELAADDVQGKRVDGRVDEREVEACYFEDVPIGVVADVKVIPAEQVGVTRREKHEKDQHEDQSDVGHLQTYEFQPP